MAKYDWDLISREYIEAPSDGDRPRLEDLAKKYNCSFNYIQQRSAKEKWVEKSKLFLRKVSDERQSQKASSLASEQMHFDSDILAVARGLLNQIVGNLKNAIAEKSFLPPKDISCLTMSLQSVQRIGRISLDIDTIDDEGMIERLTKKGYLVIDPTESPTN